VADDRVAADAERERLRAPNNAVAAKLLRQVAKGKDPVTVNAPDGVYYDPYDVQINADPFCLGSALARPEGRIALEAILKRFPEWEVDLSSATLSPTSTVRGWEAMPAVLG
jgi:hypothetical protein